MKRVCGLFIMGVIAFSLSCFQTGCGGGGASTSRGGGPDANLTALNASQVGDAATQAVKLVTPATALVEVKAAGVSPARSAPLISILETVVPVVRMQAANQKQSSAFYSENCSGGGSIEVGVPVPVSIDHVKADVNVNSCKIGLETMNGSLKVTVPVSAVNDLQHITEFTVEVSSFTYSDPHSTISLTDNFTMIATNITYSGNSLTGGSLTLGGTVSGTIDGSPVNIGCDSLGFQFSSDTSGVTVQSVSGRMNASCLGGWVTVSTNQPVFLPAGANCPTKGEIVVASGGNSVKVHIDEATFKIGIFYNGNLIKTYDNCSQVIGLCVKP